MRRTSSRKAVSSANAKLLQSIRPTRELVRKQLLETLETRTLLTVLPTAQVGTPQDLSNTADNNENSPAIAVDFNDPKKLISVWASHPTNGDPTQLTGRYS